MYEKATEATIDNPMQSGSEFHNPASEVCFATTDPVLISKAQKLMAKEYLRRKFITPADIDESGEIKPELDPHRDHSTYYVMVTPDGEDVVATLRSIEYSPDKSEKSFPLLDHSDALEDEYLDDLARLGHENIREISALARDPALDKDKVAAMKLYKKLFLDAWTNDESGNSTFIMACNPVLFENFKLLFDGSMKRIGPDLPYPGQEAVPAMFSNREGAVNVINMSRDKENVYRGVQKNVVEYFLAGSSADDIHPDVIESLEDNNYHELLEKMRTGNWPNLEKIDQKIVAKIRNSVIVGKIRENASKFKTELVAGAALMGCTAVRTGVVAQGVSPVSDVSWQAFLLLELGTTPQYVWGVGDLVRGADKSKEDYPARRKLGAFALAGSAFVAPYAYLAAAGAGDTQKGLIASGGVVAIAAVAPVAKKIKQKLSNKQR